MYMAWKSCNFAALLYINQQQILYRCNKPLPAYVVYLIVLETKSARHADALSITWTAFSSLYCLRIVEDCQNTHSSMDVFVALCTWPAQSKLGEWAHEAIRRLRRSREALQRMA